MSKVKKLARKVGSAFKKRSLRNGFSLPISFKSDYFVTTDVGIIYIKGDLGYLLTDQPGYGISIHEETVFFSYENVSLSQKGWGTSFVVVTDKSSLVNGYMFGKQKIKKAERVYKQTFSSSNGRIHQLSYSAKQKKLYICACEKNSIIEYSGKEHCTQISPFLDRFGVPILFDQNHINSVLPVENVIYFISYKAGGKSMALYIVDDECYGWELGKPGFHDLFPTENGFFTCDTFGDLEQGRVLNQHGNILEEAFGKNAIAPRGLAGSTSEILIGHSHKGPRAKRFDGNGGIVVLSDKDHARYVELPASQVYQIVRADGTHFVKNESCTNVQFREHLRSRFGQEQFVGKCVRELLPSCL